MEVIPSRPPFRARSQRAGRSRPGSASPSSKMSWSEGEQDAVGDLGRGRQDERKVGQQKVREEDRRGRRTAQRAGCAARKPEAVTKKSARRTSNVLGFRQASRETRDRIRPMRSPARPPGSPRGRGRRRRAACSTGHGIRRSRSARAPRARARRAARGGCPAWKRKDAALVKRDARASAGRGRSQRERGARDRRRGAARGRRLGATPRRRWTGSCSPTR